MNRKIEKNQISFLQPTWFVRDDDDRRREKTFGEKGREIEFQFNASI